MCAFNDFMIRYLNKYWAKIPMTAVFGLLSVWLAGCGGAPTAPPPTPTLSPLAVQGQQVFSAECARCHAIADETVIVGPPLGGIATRAGSRVDGATAEQYLFKSILAPDSYLVDGYENLMPADLAKKLTGEEMDAVVAYLLTLSE